MVTKQAGGVVTLGAALCSPAECTFLQGRACRRCSDRDRTTLPPSVVLDRPVLLALRIAHIPSSERMPSDYLKEAERVLALCKLFVSGSETKCRELFVEGSEVI